MRVMVMMLRKMSPPDTISECTDRHSSGHPGSLKLGPLGDTSLKAGGIPPLIRHHLPRGLIITWLILYSVYPPNWQYKGVRLVSGDPRIETSPHFILGAWLPSIADHQLVAAKNQPVRPKSHQIFLTCGRLARAWVSKSNFWHWFLGKKDPWSNWW